MYTMTGLRTRRCKRGAESFIILSTLLIIQGCTPPQAVGSFGQIAQEALDQGVAIFGDIQDSCVRRHADAAPLAPVFVPAALKDVSSSKLSDAGPCAVFAPEGQALTKASNVLSEYFRALRQLALFNSSTVSDPGEQAASRVALAARLNPVEVDSVNKLADLVTQVFTERYQQNHLVHILEEADPRISSITRGFEDIVSKDYEGLLREERQTRAAQYQSAGNNQPPAMILLLNRAYSEDMNGIDRRTAAAEAYVEALHQIREGHHRLVQSAAHLNARESMAALQPYTETLEALLPTLRKGL